MVGWRYAGILTAALAGLAFPGSSGSSRPAAAPLLTGTAFAARADGAFASVESAGYGGLPPCCGSQRYPGLMLRFIEHGRFGYQLVLRNRAERPVTVVDVRAIEPQQSLVHQIGTRLFAWRERPCNGPRCLPDSPSLQTPYDSVKATPVTIEPTEHLRAQLNFEIGSCRELQRASTAPTERVTVQYRYEDGPLLRQTLTLGRSQLRMRTTSVDVCASRPVSEITIGSPYATSSRNATAPDNTAVCRRLRSGAFQCSGADRCTRTRTGALLFRSGFYLTRHEIGVRVFIELPRFRGRGTYGTASGSGLSLGPANVFGTLSTHRPRFSSTTSAVSVTRTTATTIAGRVRAVVVDQRGIRFHVDGVWRCTTTGW